MTKLQTTATGKSQQSHSGAVLRFARAFLADERGQSTTEYILILSVVVMIAMKFKTTFMGQMQQAVSTLGTNIEGVVSTDSAQGQ
jgi:Flp pilus assembly pilin Flp